MRRIYTLLFLFMGLTLAAQEHIRIGSYNVAESEARRRQVVKGNFTPERYYCNSAVALSAMIADIDCDIIGLQEVCDSMWVQAGSGNIDLRKMVAKDRGDKDYDWILYPNTGKGTISYDVAIGYKKSRFKKMSSGIFWMTSTPDVVSRPYDAPKGTSRPCVWAKFKSKKTGKIFYFYSLHLVAQSVAKEVGNYYNAVNFMKVAQDRFEDKYPSFVVGDFNCKVGSRSFDEMSSGRWTSTFEFLKQAGYGVQEVDTLWGTMAKNNETGWGTSVIDHIMYYQAEPLKYWVDRRKFPIADGSMHYPSDHLPIIAEFNF